jgi:hypothetical protein
MDAIASTRVFERHCGVHLALIIILNHYESFCTGWLWLDDFQDFDYFEL